MSLPRTTSRALMMLALSVGFLLAGCTLTPVYGDPASNGLNLAATEPGSRNEQIVYQTLSARLGRSDVAADTIAARVAISNSRIGLSNVPSPVTDYQIIATVTYSVTRDGTEIASGSRRATSGYQTTGQIIADDTARIAAEEQAVRAAAEQVRLALLADLAAR